MLIPVLVNSKFSRRNQLNAAIRILNSNQDRFFFDVRFDTNVPLLAEDKLIEPDKVRREILDKHGSRDRIAIITDSQFNNNWFSLTSSDGSIITVFDWEHSFAPPALKTYLQLELILHTTACLADLTDTLMDNMAHEESVGCLFDFCEYKPDVRYKIIGGHICGVCAHKLEAHGVTSADISTIRHLLDIMRLDSVGRATSIASDTVFVAMRFSANDENDHAYKYGVDAAFKSLGLTVQRADMVASSGILIKKIFDMIDRSWAVAVLAGEENLNVFFEYGYAIGKSKPIFLITQSSKIASTPNDIRGFEHIVYPDGDYDKLEHLILHRLTGLARFSSKK